MVSVGTKAKKIEIELPRDVISALESTKIPKLKLDQKIKIALAIDLFAQGVITLAKAARLAGVSRYRFMGFLKDRDIPAFEYTEKEYRQDKETIAGCIKA
jgi:predicted HTH domain antitoxin